MCLPPRDEASAKTSTEAPRPAVTFHHKRQIPMTRRPTLLPRRHQVDDDDDRVHIREDRNVVHLVPTSLSSLEPDQERHDLWYNRQDIKDFRRQAQILSRKCRDGCQDQDEECTRGLELRTSLHRQDRKQRIVKRILEAQDDDCTAQELARIAEQHSVWSRKLALAQAHKDYYAVYHPNLQTSVLQVLPEMPLLLDCSRDMKKRSLLGTPLGRRVRCRMY